MDTTGKVAIVTGGSTGMGKGFADILLAKGTKVCIADYNAEKGEETVNELKAKYGEGRVMFSKCNVVSETEFSDTFKKTKETFGSIDIVVNNAGVGGEADHNWEQTIDVNVKGTLRGTRLGMHYLSKDNGGNGGVIINMASAAGLNPNPFSPVYCCSKAGIVQATRCYAISEEAKKSNIRLNVLCPAFVDTPMLRKMIDGDASQYTGNEDGATQAAKVRAFVEYIGIMTVEEAADVFMNVLTDETKNGAIMRCAKKTGNTYVEIKVENVS